MKIVAIDLAMKVTGMCLYDTETKQYQTTVLEQTLDGSLRVGDIPQILQATDNIVATWNGFKPDVVIVEWNNIFNNPKFMMYGLLISLDLTNQLTSKVIPIQASRWMKIADKTFVLHRKSYPNGRAGNKKWIKELVEHLHPEMKYLTQDEYDSVLMLDTYLENEKRF